VIHRAWLPNPEEVLAALDECFNYGPGEERATGYLYVAAEQPWPQPLTKIGPRLLDELEWFLDIRFTIVAFQAYANGNAWTDWHADTAFDVQAILSLGATRTFGLNHNGEPSYLSLAAGDLLFLPDHWSHSVRPDPEVTKERCSLVFRTVRPGAP
jgi:alkylated DNA repair dioxygenase AlkB